MLLRNTQPRRTDIRHPETSLTLGISSILLGILLLLTIGTVGLIWILDRSENAEEEEQYNATFHPSMAEAQQLYKKDPNTTYAHFVMCLALYDSGQFSASAEEARKVLTYPNTDSRHHELAMIWLGKCYKAQGNLTEARKEWKYVVDHYPFAESSRFSPLTIARKELDASN